MTCYELIHKLMKYDPRAKVDLVIYRATDDAEIYTEAASVRAAKDHRGKQIVEITNET